MSEHDYKWFGYDTSKCENCGKILSDEEAEKDDTPCIHRVLGGE